MPAQISTVERAGAAMERLVEARERGVLWRKWGPYLSERQWGTVRKDSSESSSNLPWLDDRRYDRCSHASRTSSFPEGCVSLRPLTPRASAPAAARTAVWRDVGGLVAY